MSADKERCWYCLRTRAEHCEYDEPGADHLRGCRKVHHEFKAAAS